MGLAGGDKTQLANSCEVRVALQPISGPRMRRERARRFAKPLIHSIELSKNVHAARLAASALWQIGGRVFQATFWASLAKGGDRAEAGC